MEWVSVWATTNRGIIEHLKSRRKDKRTYMGNNFQNCMYRRDISLNVSDDSDLRKLYTKSEGIIKVTAVYP